MKSRPAVIVMAAGRGSRFYGRDHKLAQMLDDSTVLATTLRNAVASQLPVVIVTTVRFAELARRSLAAMDVIVLPEVGEPVQPPLGVGYSIAMGVSARPDADGWVLLPGDMPMVRPETLRAVAAQLADHPVVCAQYKGKRGHPVGFAAELYSELAVLSGDIGAQRLVARYPALGLDVVDPGVLIGIDTEADLERARKLIGASAQVLPR